MSTSAVITMVIGMILIWGGLIASIVWARRTETKWSDD
jgi:hypothetical protein